MTIHSRTSGACRTTLVCSVSLVTMILTGQAVAQAADGADKYAFGIARYAQEVFDGSQVVSQSKDLVIGRSADADRAHVIHDVQNGALTIEHDGSTLIVNLVSRVSAESRFTYDRGAGRLVGSDAWTVAAFNAVVPAGADDRPPRWRQEIDLAQLTDGGKPSKILLDLARTDVTIEGVETVLLEFDAPAFGYTTLAGASVVQWARGFAVVDRTTNDIYALATQHRASVIENGALRPVAIRTTLHGIRPDGAWLMKFDKAPAVRAAVARLTETAGDPVHELDGADAGPAAVSVAGVATRLDRIAMLLLGHPANSPALALAAADSGVALVGQLPPGADIASPGAKDGASQIAMSIGKRGPTWIYARPPQLAPATVSAEEQATLAGPMEEAPAPQTPDFNAAMQRLQEQIRWHEEFSKTIAEAQRQMRNGQQPGGQFPQEVLDRLDELLGKDRPSDFNAAIKEAQEAVARARSGGRANEQFPQAVLDRLDELLGKNRQTDFNTAIRQAQEELRKAQGEGQNFPQEVLDKLDRLLGKDKPKRDEFPQEVLDRLDELLGRDRARLVDLPIGPEADLEAEYRDLFAAMESEMAKALDEFKEELLAGDWSQSELAEIDDFFANNAFDYTSMVGIVSTDLSKWGEWLATQNMRELERLALTAGYPNLASALADAQNIIRQSQDDGYRRWAMQAPSCNGLGGCGPSYLERWHMKQSIVALGDILADSRDIFSTGGFSDIGISGLNLAYLLRDHALEDGDIVQIRISQFGKVIYEGQVNLTNAGEVFDLMVGRGVASLEIFAVNEGFSSPNTAQITVDNVIRGEATQTYSLATGETATLRIEAGATAGAPAAGGTP